MAQMTEQQREFLTWRFGLFLHFNMSTFAGSTWATGYEDPELFAPDALDCGQWADAALAAGMGYGVLTVKHTGGWCLWQSDLTTHDMEAFTKYQDGAGDIVAEFCDAFRGRGLKVGLYYCGPGDFSPGKFGPPLAEGQANPMGMPPEAKPDYMDFVKGQFSELLGRYGAIDLIWFDQWNRMADFRDRWGELREHIHTLQPDCLVLANNAHDLAVTDIYSNEYCWDPSGLVGPDNELPAEISDNLAQGWFWPAHADTPQPTKTASEVIELLRLCNNRNANYLLNVPPDPHGLITEPFMARLRELGEALD